MRINLILFSFILLLMSCQKDSKINNEAEEIEIELDVTRFDKIFAQAEPKDLDELKTQFPELFPSQIPDSLWMKKMNDTLQNEINTEVLQAFPNFDNEEQRIERFYKYLSYHFEFFQTPNEIITLAEEVNYRNKIVLSEDRTPMISLDNYLGKDHKFYQGLPQYIAFMQDKKFLISDLAQLYAEEILPKNKERTFISDMIYQGKILYLKDLLMPFENDTQKIYYSEEQLKWAKENETEIWSFFVERKLIFSTDNRLADRFLNLAPYSKFYLELDNESSPRIGQYIGWQIVRKYMEKYPETTLDKLTKAEAEEIFRMSNYKPKS